MRDDAGPGASEKMEAQTLTPIGPGFGAWTPPLLIAPAVLAGLVLAMIWVALNERASAASSGAEARQAARMPLKPPSAWAPTMAS